MNVYIAHPDHDAYDALFNVLLAQFDESWWPKQGINDWIEVMTALDGTPMKHRWKPIPVEHTPASVRRNRGRPVDFPLCEFGRTAVSERALKVIEPLVRDSIEALPLECVDYPERRYYVLHVTKVIDCLDVERCEGSRMGDIFTWINRYAFKPGTTEGHHLFRVKQQRLGPNLASEEFRQLVESSGLVGLNFIPVGEDAHAAASAPAPSPRGRKKGRRLP
jgi:hypothetical protein